MSIIYLSTMLRVRRICFTRSFLLFLLASAAVCLESSGTCQYGYVACQDNQDDCIKEAWVCDGDNDCDDGSDEQNCQWTCQPGSMPCKSGQSKCVKAQFVCDGDNDCDDGSDEQNCQRTCQPGYVPCKSDQSKCIKVQWLCDGDNDCDDGSDEQNCQRTCQSGYMACHSNPSKCIKPQFVCDGDNDCDDGSDEQNCQKTCEPGYVSCQSDQLKCIRPQWICDGDSDCDDGSDEQNCQKTCESGFVPCQHDQSKCIRTQWVCNGDDDCGDGSDEQNCRSTVPFVSVRHPECEGGFVPCKDGLQCVRLIFKCDGDNDCDDGSDEQDCSDDAIRGSATAPTHSGPRGTTFAASDVTEFPFPRTRDPNIDLYACPPGFLPCDDNADCVKTEWKCDGDNDCPDGSDELHCDGEATEYVSSTRLERRATTAAAFGTTEYKFHPSEATNSPNYHHRDRNSSNVYSGAISVMLTNMPFWYLLLGGVFYCYHQRVTQIVQ